MQYKRYFRHTHPCYTACHLRLKNVHDKIWNKSKENLLTDIDTQAFKYDLGGVEDLTKRFRAVLKPGIYLRGIQWIDWRGLNSFEIQ